jgi:hypothetical protein
MVLRAFGPDEFFTVFEVFANGLFTDLKCGEPLKVVTYTCLHKIVLGIALDTKANETGHHAGRILKRIVENKICGKRHWGSFRLWYRTR